MEWTSADYMKYRELISNGVKVHEAFEIINTRGVYLLRNGCPYCGSKVVKQGLKYSCIKCGFKMDFSPYKY